MHPKCFSFLEIRAISFINKSNWHISQKTVMSLTFKMYRYFSIHVYGIHQWRILRSSYRKLAWVGFEPTTTKFCSDALTKWAIRPWVQMDLKVNFVQLLQFHFFVQRSHFISAIAFVSHHICFKQNLTQVITLAMKWLIHMVFITEGFSEVVIESWPEWDLKPQPLNSVQMLLYIYNII